MIEQTHNNPHTQGIARFVSGLRYEAIPAEVREGLAAYVLRKRDLIRLKSGLLREANVIVTDVPVASTTKTSREEARGLIPNALDSQLIGAPPPTINWKAENSQQ